MKHLLIIMLVAVLVTAGCISGNNENVTSTPIPTTITTIITEIPQPTLPTTFTTVQTTNAITSDDFKAHFMDLAYGVDNIEINKQYFSHISSFSASDSDLEEIHHFISEFNDLTKSQISETIRDTGTVDNLDIKFVPSGYNEDKSFFTYNLGANTIYINNSLKGDQRNHTILRSLYDVYGVRGSTPTYPDSLFYSEDNTNTKLSILDRKALQILYGAGINNGMSVDDIKKVIYLR